MRFKVGDIVESKETPKLVGKIYEIDHHEHGLPSPIRIIDRKSGNDFIFNEDELQFHVDLNALLKKYYNLA